MPAHCQLRAQPHCTSVFKAIFRVQELDVLCLGDPSNPVRLPADLVEHAERWANMGKIVIVAALDGTFQRKPFNQILQLVPLAEEVGPCYQDLCAMPARPLHWTCGLQTVRSDPQTAVVHLCKGRFHILYRIPKEHVNAGVEAKGNLQPLPQGSSLHSQDWP